MNDPAFMSFSVTYSYIRDKLAGLFGYQPARDYVEKTIIEAMQNDPSQTAEDHVYYTMLLATALKRLEDFQSTRDTYMSLFAEIIVDVILIRNLGS